MIIFRKQIIGLSVLFTLTALFAVSPFIFIIHSAGYHWQGVVPTGYVFDSGFYITRMVKGTHLFPFGNNPFFIERTDSSNPALSVADYIAAIPLKAGLSLTATLIFNSIFWNLVLVFLLWLLLKQFGVRGNWAFCLIPVIYLEVYGAMIRPVVLGVVLPFFLFFLLTFVTWLRKPTVLNGFIFAIGIAGTLYIYPYTWQIAFAILGLYFVWLLKNREWVKAKLQFLTIITALIIAFPAVFSIYKIISSPLFPDLLSHVGSIKTHLPSLNSFYTGRWVIINSLLWLAVARFMPRLREDKDFRFSSSFLMIAGFGVLTVLMSPIITGRDGAIGNHVARELFFWLSISTAVLAYFIFSGASFWQQRFYKKFFILLLLAANLIPIIKQSKRSLLQPFQASRNEIISAQDYAKPISWLEQYDKNPSVVWADGAISGYIPILSKYYILEPPDVAYQYWVDMSEMQERYLISHYFQEVTPPLLSQDSTVPLGLSYFRRLDDLNWKLDICNFFKFVKFGGCDPISSGSAFSEVISQKNKEIQNLIEKNERDIRPRIKELLKKYQVAYAIKDLLNDPNFHVEKLKNTREIYNDGRFAIYQFQ